MSDKEAIYKQSLEEARTYYPDTEGLSRYDPPSSSDKIIIRQLNMVIIMITKLGQQISQLERTIGKRPEAQGANLDELTKKLDTLNIGNGRIKQNPTPTPNPIPKSIAFSRRR